MPIRPSPVRYTCGRCSHHWIFAPLSDVLHQRPGVCPKCGHDKPADAQPLSGLQAVLHSWLFQQLRH